MDSPKKKQNTSQVIDSLHSTIDSLKSDLDSITISSNDYKKKYELISKKNDSIVDQLANVKHENDMINALLKRKERRIFDLENQFNELSSTNETLQLNNKNLKIRCENLNESSASSIAEFERLKISYDALISSQKEYKKHYQQELTTISKNFEQFKSENINRWESLSTKLLNDDKDFDTLLESLTNKRKTMDNIYVTKNKAILELLGKLAKLTKIHGQESKHVLQENTNIVQELIVKTPDLQEKLLKFEKVEIDLDQLLNDSHDTLSNCSFDDESTLISLPDGNGDKDKDLKINVETKDLPSRSNTMQSKRRKNKRNSMRFDSKSGPDFSNINTPTSNPISLPKRPNMNNRLSNSHRTPTPPTEYEKQFSSLGNQTIQNSNNYQNQNHQTNSNHSNYNHNLNHNLNQNSYNNYNNYNNNNNNNNNNNKSHNYNNSNNNNNNSGLNNNVNNYNASNNYTNSGYTHSSGYNNNYGQAMNANQNQNLSQSGGINTNANNFNKFNHLSNNYKHNRNSSYNPISQNNQNQQNQQAKQAKRRSYSNYNGNNANNNNSNNNNTNNITNKRNSQLLDSAINYGLNAS